MDNLAILLATYNSEKYLRQQLDSVLNQSYTDWKLYIRDDGSKDKTLEIVNEYIQRDDRLYLLHDEVKGRGAKNSFLWLLEQTDSSYTMFCDHDDVWFPEKIEVTLKQMLEMEQIYPTLPVVVHTDLEVTDPELKTISPSFWEYTRLNAIVNNMRMIPVNNVVTGCTMLINKKAKEVAFPVHPDALMHDSWITLRVLSNKGIVSALPRATIFYRQHGANTLGAIKYNNSLSHRLANLKRSIALNIQIYRIANFTVGYNIFKYLKYKVLCLHAIMNYTRTNS